MKGSEDGNYEVAIDAYFFLSAHYTEGAVYVNTSQDLHYVRWFLCEGTVEVRYIYVVVPDLSL